MSIAQTYILNAARGKEAEAQAVLERMAQAVRPLHGCESVLVLQDQETPQRFIFIETFVDAAAHKASAPMMPKEILSALGAVLDGPPDGSTYAILADL
ncbi:MAG TPA: antibiotic biosynthesis monooxygenase [Sphingobium sp.]|uniref:putative quinol monooxygenase n=1 Tax=Sphingobium sp. TaxID=1912891 RepID=UPI002ED62C60